MLHNLNKLDVVSTFYHQVKIFALTFFYFVKNNIFSLNVFVLPKKPILDSPKLILRFPIDQF